MGSIPLAGPTFLFFPFRARYPLLFHPFYEQPALAHTGPAGPFVLTMTYRSRSRGQVVMMEVFPFYYLQWNRMQIEEETE
jgi:hypothetical protein